MGIGDGELDRATQKQVFSAGRKRKYLVITLVVSIAFLIATIAAYSSDFSWHLISGSDEEFDNGNGVVDEDKIGAGDELSNTNSGVVLPGNDNKVPSGKEAFKAWKQQHQQPKPGTITHVNHTGPKGDGKKGGREHYKKPNIGNANESKNNSSASGENMNNSGETNANQNKYHLINKNKNNQTSSKSGSEDQLWSSDGVNYEVLCELPHDKTSFTQGLTYVKEKLYETTGMNGRSKLRRLNSITGEVEASIDLEKKYFGEGLCYNAVNNTLIQIVWLKQTGFVYDIDTFDLIKSFSFTTTKNQGKVSAGKLRNFSRF